jgi:polyhydroxyalkanoate synthesis regulator phasin
LSEANQPKDYSKVLVDAYFKLPKETFEMFTRSVDTYTKLFEAWRNSSAVLSSGKPESQELYNIWARDFKGIYDDLFEMLFRPMKLLAGLQWADNLTRLGDFARLSWPFGAFASIYAVFKPYENLIYLFPKETPQLLQKVVNSYVDFYSAWRDYYIGLYKAWNEATEKLSTQFAEKMANSQKDPEKPMDFGAFYDLWLETFSKTYIELLSLPNMVSVQTRLSSSTMGIIEHWRELSESLMSLSPAFPFPTKTEMDETYKRLHLLRNDIEQLSQKIEAQPTRSEMDAFYKNLRVLKEQIDGISQKVEAQPTKSEMNEAHESLRVLKKEVDEISRKVEAQRTRPRQAPKQE